jgi:hypothetical protein
MMQPLTFTILGVIASLSIADIFTLSLGDIGQYSASLVRVDINVQMKCLILTMIGNNTYVD